MRTSETIDESPKTRCTGRARSSTARGLGTLLTAACLLLPLGSAPTAHAQGGAADASQIRIESDVVYGHKDGMALFYDVLKPAEPNGAAIAYMVSGGWFSRWQPAERRAARFRYLLDRGYTVFPVHHGSAPRFKVPEAVADVKRAIRHIRMSAERWDIDPERIGVTGGSAGGHLSLMLGNDADAGADDARDPVLRVSNRVQAVVAYYPPVDLRLITGPNERFPALDFPREEAQSVSPILFVSEDDPPTLLIHGDADELVDISNSNRILAAFEEADVESEMITIEGAGHGFRRPQDRRRAEEATLAWFDEHLGAATSTDTE